jgi:gamma-glutamyl:cysteine ligase YbdK (ATP-grasp superfamily)
VSYAVENALFQWQDGERAVRSADDSSLDRAVEAVVDELRRRLGSTFVLSELADFYASGTEWAEQLATARAGSSSAATVVDAAFARYAREASNFAGGRAREEHEKP